MGAALARLWHETTAQFPYARFFATARHETRVESCDMVGEYRTDYSPLELSEIEQEIPEVEALLGRSEIVSAKQGL